MMKPPADSPEQTCLPDTALDDYALGRASEALVEHVEAHTAACKNCEQRLESTRQEVAWIRALLTRAQQPPGDPAACLDDGALALFIDGAMAPGDHEEAEPLMVEALDGLRQRDVPGPIDTILFALAQMRHMDGDGRFTCRDDRVVCQCDERRSCGKFGLPGE